MYRLVMLAIVVAVIGLGGVEQVARSTSAQHDAAVARKALADHPIVGAWRWDNDLANPDTHISYGVFHDDGTYLEVTTGAGTAVGSWLPTGERTADVTNVFQDISEDPSIIEVGTSTIQLAAEVDESGIITLASFTADVQTLDGTILFQGGPYDARGTRVEVEPMVPFGTPAAGTPTS
jgi:hypothetical protein